VRAAPFWTLKKTLGLLAVFSLLVPTTLIWIGLLRRRVALQMAELEKAAETSQAIKDLSLSIQSVSTERRFDAQVSVRGSEDIVQLVIGFNRMLSELQQRDRDKVAAEAKLQHMAMVDELTGLPNRRLLFDRLSQSLTRARRQNHMMAMLYIDLDGFKLVNDNLGHAVGDLLLGQVAQRLKSRSRQSDILARSGATNSHSSWSTSNARAMLKKRHAVFWMRSRLRFRSRVTISRSAPASASAFFPRMESKADNCCSRPIARCMRRSATARIALCSSAMTWESRRASE
jgi:predicted signal transduction protein with EAL and GGDEF domain